MLENISSFLAFFLALLSIYQFWQPKKKKYIDFQVQKLVVYFLLCSQHPSWWCTAIFCWHFCWPQQYIGFWFHLSGPEHFTWMLLLTSNSTCLQMSLVISPVCLPAFVPLSFLSQPKILGFDSSLPSSCQQTYPFFCLSSFQTQPFLSFPLLDPQFIHPFIQKAI